jgi:hypothetical protein
MAADEQTEKGEIIAEMLAEYFEVDQGEIQGYLIGVERATPEGGLIFSSVWSMNKPMWQLLGFAEELKAHVEKQRGGDTLPDINGQPAESRQVRRARTRGSGRGKRASS